MHRPILHNYTVPDVQTKSPQLHRTRRIEQVYIITPYRTQRPSLHNYTIPDAGTKIT